MIGLKGWISSIFSSKLILFIELTLSFLLSVNIPRVFGLELICTNGKLDIMIKVTKMKRKIDHFLKAKIQSDSE